MPEGTIVSTNYAINSIISNWLGWLNANALLRLYQTDLAPTPANVWSDVEEASFTGYTAMSLVGIIPGQMKVIDGEYQSLVGPVPFNCTGGDSQTVYGAAILDGSANVWMWCPFAAPVVFESGVAYAVTLGLQEWALVIVP